MEGSPDAQQPQGSPVRPSTAAARAGGSKDDDAVAVRVAVHIRPLVENELAKGCQEILDVTPNTPQISVGLHRFTYDNVYGSDAGDSAVNLYPDCVQPLVAGLFKGYNATVFAYGQTGSGKTYTMGSAWSPEEENQGVIPSVMDELFTRVEHEPNTDFTIKVSFVEIHKEEVRDLLWTNSSAPRPVVTIRELPTGVSLAGACERHVNSREEMSHVLMQGTLMRAVAATNMNNRSSRSHAIFTITVEQRRRQLLRPASAPPAVDGTPRHGGLQDGDTSSASSEGEDDSAEEEEEEVEAGDEYLIAKMHLVDLAGSERAKRTGAEGARLKEAININKGLLALAKVITALVDGQSHVPYRDSKLTRLLQDSLGGNSRTVMIACVSPADINREETLNTLRYADRARRIKNKPVVNRDPMAAQLAALRQQIASLRAENLALRVALGGDKEAAAAIAAAGRGSQGVASAALQEAYDDLAVRFNGLEIENAKQQMQLESSHDEVKLLRAGLLTAETHRDQLMLRVQALQAAAAASNDPAMKEALTQDTEAAAAAAAAEHRDAAGSPVAADGAASAATAAAAAPADGAAGTTGLLAEVGVVQTLRARVAELEAELRQVRSLQRMASSAFVRGLCSSSRGLSTSRQNSSSGGFLQVVGHHGPHGQISRAASRLAAHPIGDIHGSDGGTCISEGIFSCDDGAGGDLSPVTPARPSGMCGGDLLGEPLLEVAPDAEILAQSAAHMMAREELALKLEVLGRQMEAKQKRLLALQSAADMEGAKSKYMVELQKERDTLAKEKTALLQKLQAVTQASAEERKRLEQTYKDKLTAVERRLKDLAEREKAAKRNAAQLGRVQSVCQQLQADISRMKSQRAAVQRRMEAKEKEFREWRLTREREVIQLRRNAQRQNAALQQHQAMHCKQQAVLKRKTEEAEAARRKLRELTELQARVRRDKQAQQAAASGECSGGADMDLQPNASAPLLRTSKARREWIEQEMELCSTSWQYQRVLEGELAQRAEATRKLREVQKQLMLLGGLVPPSPVVTAAAAAAARGRRNSSNLGSSAGGGGGSSLHEEAALTQEAKRLQDAIDGHTRSVKELQEQWERARAEEQSRGAGAADVRRWIGIRNTVEAREMLRTLFISACSQRALVCESQMELAKLQESNDILEIRLDMAVQQAAEARRKALEAEATAAAVITTPAHQLALVAAVAAAGGRASSSNGGSDDDGGEAAAAAAGGDSSSTPAGQQQPHLQQQRSRRLLQQELLSGGSADPLDDLAEQRDPVDIEADSLLHSLGLPSIQEMPSPAEGCGSGSMEQDGADGSSNAAAAVAERLAARRERYWRGVPSGSSSRASVLLKAAAEGWPSQDGAEAGKASAGSSRGPSATAQDLAAKLDALEGEWQGYKRTAAAAAASGGTRRSMSSGGGIWPSSRRSSSVPASPRCGHTPHSAAGQTLTPLETPLGGRQQQQRGRRVSLSANNSPTGRAWGQQQEAPAAGADADDAGQAGEQQQQQGLLLRSISSIFKMGRDAVAAVTGVKSPSVEPEDTVVKSLTFIDADDGPVRCNSSSPGDAPQARRCSASSSPDLPGGRQDRQQRPRSTSGAGANPARAGSNAGATTDEEIFQLDGHGSGEGGEGGDTPGQHSGGRRPRSRQQGSQAEAVDSGEGGSEDEEFEDAEDDDGDDEQEDPSYDPVLHATPAAVRRGSRQSGGHGKGKGGRASVSSEQDGMSGGANSRASSRSRRSSSNQQQQQQQQQSSSGAGSSAAASAAMARNLAAQVSFNHEKRQGWERPVLEDINNRRAGQGMAPVDKLTIQLLKENLVGQELDGRPWAPGNKTKDILIADYRRVLQLSDRDEDVTSINRITGAANWPMPGSLPCSLPSSPQPGSWAAAARRGADAEAAAAVAEGGSSSSSSSRPTSGVGARRVLSQSLPPSPTGRDASRSAAGGTSPLRAFQPHSRIPAGIGQGLGHHRGRASPPQTHVMPIGYGISRIGSPPGSAVSPALVGPSPSRAAPSPRVSPSPRVVREQWGGAIAEQGASPRLIGGNSRAGRAGRMSCFVSQSLDGSLLQAGAAREQQAQLAALQQGPQRALRSNSSGNSNAPGSASKLRVIIPQTTRIDGPYSNRVPIQGPTSSTGSTERLRQQQQASRDGQPNWR